MPIAIIKKLYKKIKAPGEFRRMFVNASWLIYDRVIRLAVNLFIVGWMARYLGPKQYGNLDYAMSLTSLVACFASFGINDILIRDLINNPDQSRKILGSGFFIRQFGGLLAIVISIIAVFIVNSDEPLTKLLVSIVSLTYLFSSFDVVDLYFQSQIKSKYPVIANNIAFIIMSGVRIALILSEAPLIAFAAAASAEVLLAQAGMFIVYRHHTGHYMFHWRFDWVITRSILRDSWPLLISWLSGVMFFKIGQIMLGNMVDYREVGEYAAAVKISEVWYFVPWAVGITLYPKIVELKKKSEEQYYSRLQEFFSIMAVLSYSVVLPTFFLSKWLIAIIFGDQFVKASMILNIHIWAGIFYSMGIARNYWCNAENHSRAILYSTVCGAVINVILNIPLILMYGGLGAAWSTMIARIVSVYLSTVFISRKIFFMQTQAFTLKGLSRLIKQDIIG
ncbi:MAG: flippase [Spirochaetes bacterium]|nr:flippase [Spirochaetota bacterium]